MKQKHKEKELAEDENFGDSTPALIRSWLWNVMEYPWTSKTAQVSLFVCNLGHREFVADSVIQASGTVEFEDGLRTGVLLQDC